MKDLQTLLDSETQTQRIEDLKRIKERLNKLKIIEPPEDVKKLKDKRQAFLAGQLNMLMRIYCFNKELDEIIRKVKNEPNT